MFSKAKFLASDLVMCKQHVHRSFVGGDVWETSKMINVFKALRCLVVPGLFEFEKKGVGDFEKNPASIIVFPFFHGGE